MLPTHQLLAPSRLVPVAAHSGRLSRSATAAASTEGGARYRKLAWPGAVSAWHTQVLGPRAYARPVPRYPLDDVSVLVSVTDDGRSRFRGTAFPVSTLGMWMTAGHCVTEDASEGLALFAAGQLRLDAVKEVFRHPDLDLAILRSASADTVPFTISGRAAWGSEVSVVGYPEDLFIDREGRDRPRARILKGHIQRVETDQDTGTSFGDFELSMATPGGMSGSPVVLQTDQNVAGIVIGNHDSYVIDFLSEELRDGAQVRSHEVQRAVTFGAALDLRRAPVDRDAPVVTRA